MYKLGSMYGASSRHLYDILQGISYWNVFYELTLTDRNMQARFYLKVVLKFWGFERFLKK
jgi:hypothetical protein